MCLNAVIPIDYNLINFYEKKDRNFTHVRPKTRTRVNEHGCSGKDICKLHEFSLKIYSNYHRCTHVALPNQWLTAA